MSLLVPFLAIVFMMFLIIFTSCLAQRFSRMVKWIREAFKKKLKVWKFSTLCLPHFLWNISTLFIFLFRHESNSTITNVANLSISQQTPPASKKQSFSLHHHLHNHFIHHLQHHLYHHLHYHLHHKTFITTFIIIRLW